MFYNLSNLDIKMMYISNELNDSNEWMYNFFVQTKFFAEHRLKKIGGNLNSKDALQEAYLGLWMAIITYDYQKNFDFYRWAQWNISKKIRNSRIEANKFLKAKSSIKFKLDSYNVEQKVEARDICQRYLLSYNNVLSKREKMIIIDNILLEKKLTEIANDIELSIERTRQIRNQGLEKLRKILI
tara:strand:- start:4075 stop:4626 length:552 start_codon:yes stop_codon:yes gene_type:complete